MGKPIALRLETEAPDLVASLRVEDELGKNLQRETRDVHDCRDSAIIVTEKCLGPMGAGMLQGGPIEEWIPVRQDPWAVWFKQYSCHEESDTAEQLNWTSTQVWKSLSHIRLFASPWTIVYQAPLSMAFSRQEYWSG